MSALVSLRQAVRDKLDEAWQAHLASTPGTLGYEASYTEIERCEAYLRNHEEHQ